MLGCKLPRSHISEIECGAAHRHIYNRCNDRSCQLDRATAGNICRIALQGPCCAIGIYGNRRKSNGQCLALCPGIIGGKLLGITEKPCGKLFSVSDKLLVEFDALVTTNCLLCDFPTATAPKSNVVPLNDVLLKDMITTLPVALPMSCIGKGFGVLVELLTMFSGRLYLLGAVGLKVTVYT